MAKMPVAMVIDLVAMEIQLVTMTSYTSHHSSLVMYMVHMGFYHFYLPVARDFRLVAMEIQLVAMET